VRIYLSRSEESASEFIAAMKQHQVEVISFSQIEILPLAFTCVQAVDWIFFSSSHAAQVFFQQEKFNPNQFYGAIGKATAAAVPGPCAFVGDSSNTEEVALHFKDKIQNQSVLFPIGNRSVRSVQSVLDVNQFHEVVVYETADHPKPIGLCDAYIFSSPSNVFAALKHTDLHDSFCFSFGKSTSQALMAAGVRKISELKSLNTEAMVQQILAELNG
jgi:uroporphyrinogen-III synthase